MAAPIIQEIELALAALSVTKLKAATQAALTEGTDSKVAVSNLDKVESKLGSIGTAAKAVKGILAEFGLIVGIGEIVKQLIDANEEFEHLTAQLRAFTNTASDAREVYESLNDIAKRSPFTISDLTAAYITLRNQGINPSTAQMEHFGNIAAGLGTTVSTVAEAIASLARGQTRAFQQLGVQVVAVGDNLKLTFRGTTTEIGNNAAAIIGYLDKIGKNQFGTASADQANTLGGSFVQLKKGASDLFEALGQSGLSGMLVSLIKSLTSLLERAAANKKGIAEFLTVVDMTTSGARVLFTVLKEIGLDAMDLFAAAVLTVKGNIEVADGTWQSFTGNVLEGAAKIKQGLADIAASGQRIENIGSRFTATGNQITGEGDRLALERQRNLAAADPKVRAFLDQGSGKGLGPGTAPTNTINQTLTADPLADRVQLLRQLAQVTTDTATKQALLDRAIALINADLAGHNHTMDETIKRWAELGELQKDQIKTAADAQSAREASDISFLTITGAPGGDFVQKQNEMMLDDLKKKATDTTNEIRDEFGNMWSTPNFEDTPLGAFFDDLQTVGMGAAESIVQSIGGALSDIFSDAKTTGSALADLGKGMAKGVITEIEKLAAAKVGENIGHAFDDFRSAAEAAANPVTAFLAPMWTHAGELALLAAGKWALIGGAAAALSGGGSGSSAGGGSSATQTGDVSSASAAQAAAQKLQPIQLTVNAFDKNNPLDQDMLADALQPAIERSGNRYLIGGR